MPTPNTLLYAGAPTVASIDPSSYLDHFSEPFRLFISPDDATIRENVTTHAQTSHATWRSLPLSRRPLQTGLTPTHSRDHVSTHAAHHRDFFNSASIVSSGGGGLYQPSEKDGQEQDADGLLTQFYEQSLAMHDSIPSSQLDDATDKNETINLDETSFLTTSSLSNATATAHSPRPAVPIPPHLSDLEDVPTAKQLLALHPQTITLNIIAGILSIAQPRTVTTRWGKTLSLVEILLGDDTRSGFSVTFWLPEEASDSGGSRMLNQLRRQDVVLLRNVALHVFRGKVYGQSLRRGQTTVHLLWRRRGTGGCYSSRDLAGGRREKQPDRQLQKTARVKGWVLRFVGADSGTGDKVEVLKGWDKPPDDTQ